MARSFPSVISPPAEIHFSGWRSDTHTLERNGWEIAVEENIEYGSLQILLRNTQCEMILRGECRDYHYERRTRSHDYPIFHIVHSSRREIHPNRVMASYENFSVIDAIPEYAMLQEVDLYTLPLFKKKGLIVPTAEALIVEPKTVMELLEEIRKRQAPDQAKIRERMHRSEVMQQTHAQIISFKEAA